MTMPFIVEGRLGTCPPAYDTIRVVVDTPISLPQTQVYPFFEGHTTQLHVPGLPDTTGYTVLWSPSTGLSCATCFRPFVQPDTTIEYLITLTDSNGCVSTTHLGMRKLLSCDDNTVLVPNGFSPNGDGNNDVLYARSTAVEISRFDVYNRYGERVFTSSSINNGWDGTFSGEALPSGVFVYFVEYTCPLTGQTVIKSGNVMLIR
jgi:gliding motility-associated-like protein